MTNFVGSFKHTKSKKTTINLILCMNRSNYTVKHNDVKIQRRTSFEIG